MHLRFVLFLILLSSLLRAEIDYIVENTNFTINQGSLGQTGAKDHLYNYDRLRLNLDYTEGDYFIKLIGDGVNYLGEQYIDSPYFALTTQIKSDTPFKTQTSFYDYKVGTTYAKLYRLYGGYEDDKNKITLGLQNITMGVGRLWTPTNLFNPKNIYTLEPDEVFGVAAISYTRHINDTTDISVTSSVRKDNSLKYAARYKTFQDFADIAVDALYSNNTKMIGYEIEANLGETGVEVRSEGAFISSKLVFQQENMDFFQGIIGADYGFVNGITVVFEALYSSQTFTLTEVLANLNSDIVGNLTYSNFYAGGTLSYSFNIFLDASLIYIESFNNKNSRFVSPTLTYTLNDYNTFILGAMLQFGEKGSEFGSYKSNTYYLNYKLSF